MYQDYFQLNQAPFSIAPDPNFLYLSAGHSEALAHLMYGFSHGGFVLITGEVGTGKTTLLRNLIKQTPPDLDVAFILNPRLTVKELLETLCDELGVRYPEGSNPTVKQYIDVLNRHLLAAHEKGRSTVVIIDEAQNLSPAVLEQIRLLTNLETDERKLLRIILLGQPELGALLDRAELRQLAQRITARYHLGALNREDTYAYIVHRLARAGGNPKLFSRGALSRLFRISKGVPRLINVVADRALLGAYVEGRHQVTGRIVSRAAREVLGRRPRYRLWIGVGAASVSAAGVAWAYLTLPEVVDLPTTIPAVSSPAVQAPSEPVPVPETTLAEPVPAAITPPARAPSLTSRDDGVDGAGSQAASPSETEPAPVPVPEIAPEIAASVAVEPDIRRPPMSSFQSQRRAYAAVFDAWGADYRTAPPSMIPCNFAPSAGLQCLGLRGTWSDIEAMNLPVVLELWDSERAPYFAAVTHIHDGNMTLHLGDTVLTVTPKALRDVWFGQYVVLWQTPPQYRGSISRGNTHPTVSWLRVQLEALVSDDLSSGRPEYFDPRLDEAVRDFQGSEGLLTDGIVGPATWIRLAARLDLPAPKLDG
ncbi:MAG TPA: AAA family ATPase [Pseudomonadales bacterium]|jgi:general secretion pathway protein A